jgi:hypothetical protein
MAGLEKSKECMKSGFHFARQGRKQPNSEIGFYLKKIASWTRLSTRKNNL